MYLEMQNKLKKRNATGIDFIDKIVGEEGIKTDVAVKIAPGTIPIIVLAILVGVTGSILLAGAIKKAVQKK